METGNGNAVLQKIMCLTLLSGLIFAGGALAQAQSEESEDEAEPEIQLIEVVGYRASLAKSLGIKRDSDSIVDVVSAEDIGKFPDLNVADALQRIPGVQVEKDERDGEGVRVNIRGTPSHLNLALLNNQQIATATASNRRTELRDRSFNYYLLPTEIVDTLEVYKSPEANVDEGSMGGTVIVRTRRPLDAEANSGAVTARYFNFDNAGENKPYLSGLYSWKNEAETFGFNIAYIHRDSITLMDSVRNNAGYFVARDYTGGGNPNERIPARVGSNRYTSDYSLDTPFVTVQFAPSDYSQISFTAMNSKTERSSVGQYVYGTSWLPLVPRWDNTPLEGNWATVENDTIVAARIPECCDNTSAVSSANAAGWSTGWYQDEVETTAFDVEATVEGDNWNLNVQAGHSFADGLALDRTVSFVSASSVDFDVREGALQWGIDPSLTPDDFRFRYSHINTIRNDSDTSFFQADFELDIGNELFSSVEAGVKYREYDKGAGRVKRDFAETGTLAQFSDGVQISGLKVGDPAPTAYWDIDIGALNAWHDANPFQPGTANGMWVDPNDRYRVNEEVTAAYLKGNFDTATIRGNIGVRAVQTSTLAAARRYSGFNYRAERDNVAEDTNLESKYTDILPSLNVNYVGFEDVVLRFAAAQVMARPNYVAIAPFETRNCGVRGCLGFEGNPDLEPYRANQYDLSAEWYFDESSFLAFALFYKDVKTFLDLEQFDANRDYRTERDGEAVVENRLFTIERPINGNGLSIQGFEVNFQRDLAYGFGVTANYTYAEADLTPTEAQIERGQEPVLFGHSEDTWNATLFYQRFGLAARLSYTFRGEYPSNHLNSASVLSSAQQFTSVGSNPNGTSIDTEAVVGGAGAARGLIGYKGDFGSLDFNASYHVTDNIEVLFQVINLNDEEIFWYASREDHTADPGRPIGLYNHGRRYALGIKMRFGGV